MHTHTHTRTRTHTHMHAHTHTHTQAAHRRQTLVIAIFYALWPRLTLLYVYAFNYYEVFLPFMRYHFPTNNKEMVDSYDESREQEGDDVPQDHAEVSRCKIAVCN